jgi:hypothetical protein
MTISRNLLKLSCYLIAALVICPMFSSAAVAQRLSYAIPDAPAATTETAALAIVATPPVTAAAPAGSIEHRFWDRQNIALFAASAALSGADFAVTRSNLQGGGQELNPVVRLFGRSSAGLTLNFAGETAAVVSLSYLFHRTAHHKLERAISVVNIGASAVAVSYGIASR